jgi:hypothetical protein
MVDPFELKVHQQIERLRSQDYRAIEAEVTQKRLAWLAQNHPIQNGQGPLSPRQAYQLLFFDYMGLSADDLPVVQETESQITWLSKNPCPTLAACQRLGLDTRTVCRLAYEASTQAFLSYLDPQLRFVRSYDEIRPYAPHCRESILRVDLQISSLDNL